MGQTGLAASFTTVPVNGGGTLPLPANEDSAIYLVTVQKGPGMTLVLPAAADSTSRFLTIRRVNNGGRVIVRAQPTDSIAGDSDGLALNTSGDHVTLVSDGANWFVFSHNR